MDNEETIPKQNPLTLDSAILEEATTTSRSDQPGMFRRTDQSVPISSATDAISPRAEIHPFDVTSLNDNTLPNIAFSSTADDSDGVGGVQEDGHHPTADDPSNPLIAPRYGMSFPIRVVDYETYEPPPPPRPSWIQFICCCFITDYYIYYARKIRTSKSILLVLTALLLIPLSAFYFGIAYVDSCKLAAYSPPIVSIMGLLGIFVIALRMLAVSRRALDVRVCKDADTLTGVIGLMIMLFLLAVLALGNFFIKYPNFYDLEDPVYCDKTYYYFVLCTNLVVLILCIFGLLLHIPMKSSDPVQVVPLEYFETI